MMLKGIANGVPKDITRIAMKGKNLAYDKIQSANINSAGTITTPLQGFDVSIAKIVIGKTYTANSYVLAFYENEPAAGSVSYDNSRIVGTNGRPITFTAPITGYVAFRVDGNNRDTPMCNEGTTILPYEPYGMQSGWEVRDQQGTILWGADKTLTGTNSIAMKGYGLPLKGVEVEGNMAQESPNLVNPADNVPGYQNNDGSIHVPGSGNEMTTDFLPFTGTIYAKIKATTSGNINWVAYNSEKQALYFYGGNWSGANPSFTISPSSGYSTAYIRISWTQGATQPICVTTTQQSAFVPFNPEPDDPIWPQETGEKTGNLFDYYVATCNIESNGLMRKSTGYDVYCAPVTAGKTYTIQLGSAVYGFFSEKPAIGAITNDGQRHLILSLIDGVITIPEGTTWLGVRAVAGEVPMLNEGNTPLSPEPLGYKTPLTCAGQTTPVYLGQTQTVRRIKKYEFTGNEQWNVTAGKFYLQEISPDYKHAADALTYFCSHFPVYPQTNRAANVPDNMLSFGSSSASQRVYCTYTGVSTTADFKSYLAAQYAAGTPVTVWYVLATPETGIVNEPIRKIGTYADTLTVTDQDVTITPADGNDTLTIGTTLAPSALSITGHVKARTT